MGQMTYRHLGRSDEVVSAVGLGGFHLSKPEDPAVAVEVVRSAIERGITFMDNSWDYAMGESERRMGLALEGGYRSQVFLMTKVDSRSRDGVMSQFEESLGRLRTDHVDLLQLHEVIRPGEPERFFAPGGGWEAFLELREQGVVRYLGFTGHKSPEFHLEMLRGSLDRGVVWDAAQMPVNPYDANFESFSARVVPICQEHGIAVLGMKPLGAGKLPGHAGVAARDLLRWALSQPVSVVITGCESVEEVTQAVEAASDFEPMGPTEIAEIRANVSGLAEEGRLEEYKTTDTHDSTEQHTEWLT